ncbi:CiV19.5g2-like-8 protein [Chelonus insularis]|nr:CiV19.5g2-like-8 protein [Chelonus insularis]
MDSMNTHEYRMKLARKIIRLKKELAERNSEPVNKWEKHSVPDHAYIKKLQHDKARLQAELRFMCRKIVMLNEEIIEALVVD